VATSPKDQPRERGIVTSVSVIVPDEFVHRLYPVAGAPAHVRTCEVTAVGAWKQIVLAALHGATAALVVPWVKALKPAVVPVVVSVVAEATPSVGVTNVGEVARGITVPLPVVV
jgi:hypothetical protein